MTSAEDYADFRILARCPSGSKKNSTSYDSTNGIMRYRFTLGEVLSWNIDIDVIVGNGWTRITLKEIPRFIVDAFDFIMADGLQLDGIFRKEGNSARLNRQEVQEVYRGIRAIPSDFTVLDVCTMVKRFLKDLKPTLLNSDDVRYKLIERAKKARLSGDFNLSHQDMVRMFETPTQQLSSAHLGTLGYVMRLLSRIAKHSDSHKMTTDNLAVVLVGSVFGDFMAGGGTESRKKMQHARKCSEAELHAKKEDMGIQVAAVKLLIVNANLIALPKSHYVSSNRLHWNAHNNIRSTSAMPNIRCASVSEQEPPSMTPSPYGGSNHVFSMAKASLNHHNNPRGLTRRDSDLTHVKSIKPQVTSATAKRSSSFLPIASLRGLRDKVSNQFLKRNKSPSPEKHRRQIFHTEPAYSPFSGSMASPHLSRRMHSGVDSDSDFSPIQLRDRHSGDSALPKKGSTSSGRKSRTLTKKGNINSHRSSGRDSGSQKSFRMSPRSQKSHRSQKRQSGGSTSTNSTATSRSLRRFSASEQNSLKLSVGDATPPLEKKKRNGVIRRNTVNTADDPRDQTQNRIHKPLGLPTRRSTFWGVETIAEEKENYRKSLVMMEQEQEETQNDKVPEMSILELMNHQARLRRVGVAERRRRKAACDTSDSMMVLNGSMATFDKLPVQDKKVTIGNTSGGGDGAQSPVESPVFATPVVENSAKPISAAAKSKIGQQLEREMKQRLDVMATPMVSRRTAGESIQHHRNPSGIPLRTLENFGIQQNGRAWVGKTQTVFSSPIPCSDVRLIKEAEKVSPILARSPIFRSPSAVPIGKSPKPISPFNFRSKSHLTDENMVFSQDYTALATPPRDRRPPAQNLQQSPRRIQSNLIYFTPKVQRRGNESPSLTAPRPIIRSSSSLLVSPRASSSLKERHPSPSPLIHMNQRKSADESVFKCPILPPMRSHEMKKTMSSLEVKKRDSVVSDDALGFGEYNEILKTATEDTKFPCPHQLVEARPSVTMLRSSQCGLVQSRINHFQGIERSHRVSTDLSSSGGGGGGGGGRHSAVSQTSLKSIDTVSSSSRA